MSHNIVNLVDDSGELDDMRREEDREYYNKAMSKYSKMKSIEEAE